MNRFTLRILEINGNILTLEHSDGKSVYTLQREVVNASELAIEMQGHLDSTGGEMRFVHTS